MILSLSNIMRPTNIMMQQKQIKSVAFPSAYEGLKNSGILFRYKSNIFKVSLSKDFQFIGKEYYWMKKQLK